MKIDHKAITLSTLLWCFYMTEKGEEFRLMLMIHIISKRNDSLNIILLCTLHYPVSFLFIIYSIYLFVRVSKYSKSSCKIKKISI